jgi:hypothetical protein
VLPPPGRRVPSPARTLLLGLSSYKPIRQSHLALLSFGYSPRSRRPCRLLPAPAASGVLPTLSLRIFPEMPEPMPRRSAECVCLVLPQHSSAFPIIRMGRLPASFREHDFSRVGLRGCSYFVMFRPPILLASQIVPTAASFPRRAAETLHPSRTCVVTFARIGLATRPTTGNWRDEDFHLARFAALSAAHERSRRFHRPPNIALRWVHTVRLEGWTFRQHISSCCVTPVLLTPLSQIQS